MKIVKNVQTYTYVDMGDFSKDISSANKVHGYRSEERAAGTARSVTSWRGWRRSVRGAVSVEDAGRRCRLQAALGAPRKLQLNDKQQRRLCLRYDLWLCL